MPALAGYFVMRQIHTREAAHRVAEALREYWTIAWTWLLFRPYARVHRLLATTAPGTMPGQQRKNRRKALVDHAMPHPSESAGCALFTFIQFARTFGPDDVTTADKTATPAFFACLAHSACPSPQIGCSFGGPHSLSRAGFLLVYAIGLRYRVVIGAFAVGIPAQ